MIRYFTRKLFYGLLVMMGVMILVFFLFQGFGDPSRLIMGQTADDATQQNIRRELYLDQPKWKQFILYMNDVSPLSIHTENEIADKKLKGVFIGGSAKFCLKVPYLRRSYQSKREVWQVLMEALPGTILLASAAMLLAILAGIPLGILAALKKNTWMDSSAMFTSVLGISAPSFFMGIIVAYAFGFVLSRYTGLGMTGSLYDTDPFAGRQLQFRNLLLPAITLGIRPLAIITQLTRS
ncbi:MAG: ABC transporter permease, partial [Flavitalea sp.]